MKQHFAIHSMFQAKMQLNGTVPSGGNGSGGKIPRASPHSGSSEGHKGIDEDQRSLVLQVRAESGQHGALQLHMLWGGQLQADRACTGTAWAVEPHLVTGCLVAVLVCAGRAQVRRPGPPGQPARGAQEMGAVPRGGEQGKGARPSRVGAVRTA
jgi:hypothetical protein